MTPIDWKPSAVRPSCPGAVRHHSLMTPIDWKRKVVGLFAEFAIQSHHSLMTPIDWKPPAIKGER